MDEVDWSGRAPSGVSERVRRAAARPGTAAAHADSGTNATATISETSELNSRSAGEAAVPPGAGYCVPPRAWTNATLSKPLHAMMPRYAISPDQACMRPHVTSSNSTTAAAMLIECAHRAHQASQPRSPAQRRRSITQVSIAGMPHATRQAFIRAADGVASALGKDIVAIRMPQTIQMQKNRVL